MAGAKPFHFCLNAMQTGADVDDLASKLYDALSDNERLSLLDGDLSFGNGILTIIKEGYNGRPIHAGEIPRIALPGIRFCDGPRGCVSGNSTAFPVSSARAATFDIQLEEAIGRAIGKEVRAQGGNTFGGICINLLRHPAWGRAQESYGEDPMVLGEMGAALARGVQENVMGIVKHFALNSMENSRFRVDVRCGEHDLHEAFLPHFKRVVHEGVSIVMAAYNSVNGTYCGDNRVLLTDILRDEWGFKGVVMSDFVFGIRKPIESVGAGLDLEMPFRQQRAEKLPSALENGILPREDVRIACTRLIRAQLKYYHQISGKPVPSLDVVACSEHVSLARKAAAQSMVLLQNAEIGKERLLPFSEDVKEVALLGSLAAEPNTGDLGSSSVSAPYTATILEGFQKNKRYQTIYNDGSGIKNAARIAKDADIAVVVVGLGPRDEGEFIMTDDYDSLRLGPGWFGTPILVYLVILMGKILGYFLSAKGGDRASLRLKPKDVHLVTSVAHANPRTVLVLIGGSCIILDEEIRKLVPTILIAWYPGMEGGRALQDVLSGAVEPSGRLPFVVPESEADLPFFERYTTKISYDRWWGYRLLNKTGKVAAYPFGFGLGYGKIETDALEIPTILERTFVAMVQVSNLSARKSSTVIQIYAGKTERESWDYKNVLVGFLKVSVNANESMKVVVNCRLESLGRRDSETRIWSVSEGKLRVCAAQHEGDSSARFVTVQVPEIRW